MEKELEEILKVLEELEAQMEIHKHLVQILEKRFKEIQNGRS